MKQLNITIHPFSALAGMALLGLVWVTAGAMPLQGSSSTRDVSAIEVVSDPHPRDFVRIVEGAPYTVPTDKIFVGTGVRHTQLLSSNTKGQLGVYVIFDGVPVLAVYSRMYVTSFQAADGGFGNEMNLPVGLSAPAGTVINVDGAMGSGSTSYDPGGCLLGYLVDA